MGHKVYFKDEEKAHDFSDRIGSGGVEREEKGVWENLLCKTIIVYNDLKNKYDMFERAKVVMLPTNEKAPLCISANKLCKYFGFDPEVEILRHQHLYITLNDEIKKGDWCYHLNEKELIQFNSNNGDLRDLCRKVIATTDSSLVQTKKIIGKDKIGNLYNPIFLPQPSRSFIEKYIKEYNKGNMITDVLVEYEEEYIEPPENFHSNSGVLIPKLRVSKDNTITIKKVKDSWNREEVVKLCKKALQTGFNEGSNDELSPSYLNWDEWIEKNL